MLYLTHQTGDLPKTLPIETALSFGKASGNDFCLHHPEVSHRHFRVENHGNHHLIRDLQSQNGTLLNGTRILIAQLEPGDRIQVGKDIFFQVHHRLSTTVSSQTLRSSNSFWDRQLKTLPAAAQSDLSVLLLGESGCGKEVLARQIHEHSRRCLQPMISINCSALSPSLIESELFGHTKGSFTGATTDRKGAFEAARGGTLFLDEIGDLPLSLQPKLLRALENSEIRPVGSDKTRKTDVRVVAATHQGLAEKVRRKEFRADLYYRLNVLPFSIPPLRLRMEDFDRLAYGFAKEYRVRLSHEALLQLKEHSWPGNIRELKNTIARLSALFAGEHIKSAQVELALNSFTLTPEGSLGPFSGRSSKIQKIEKELIVERLLANAGNQRKTAADLGVPKSTLHDRIRSYQINIPQLLQTS